MPVLNQLNIHVCRNSAYSPNFNPIEGAIAVCKKSIKKKRIRTQILNKPMNMEAEIEKSFKEIKKTVCVNFISKSNELLFAVQ